MKETQLLSKLNPAHPDFLPILQNIREKYNIPEISPEDELINTNFCGDCFYVKPN